MKLKVILIVWALFFGLSVSAQSSSNTKNTQHSPDPNINYRLFQTNNRWTFIKLDTRNGKMTHVQYSTGDGDSFEYPLNPKSLLGEGEEEKPGRFFLYPTENSFNFLLLDQISGKVWQVQWNQDADKRLVIRIPKYFS